MKTGRHTDWAAAVAEFAVKVYSEQGEFEKVVAEAVSRLGQPCRDGGAEASQWLHCLAVTSLLLERLMSLHQLVGCEIGSQEILDALLLPAVSKKKVLYASHLRDFPDCCEIFCSIIHRNNLDAQSSFLTSVGMGQVHELHPISGVAAGERFQLFKAMVVF